MAALTIHQIPVLADNYCYLLHDAATGVTAVIDPAEAAPILAELEKTGWTLGHILNTHYHGDHTGGNLALKAATGATVAGPAGESAKIPGIDVALGEGDTYAVGVAVASITEVPGHTGGHIAFYFAESNALFSGDSLFALGCGRVFEGTGPQMWQSLDKLRHLPAETLVYCGHEYTESNARFAVTIEPENAALADRVVGIKATRAAGRWTVPSLMADELATNPFLRADRPELQAAIGMAGRPAAEVFTEIRRRKDVF
ncbi:MAG TPA: hydroxyacylglutathione hydrolase [Stellaceae bacterium]|nr:hydroxyacylglutathione hydrolase [Stellaceae bacterium]